MKSDQRTSVSRVSSEMLQRVRTLRGGPATSARVLAGALLLGVSCNALTVREALAGDTAVIVAAAQPGEFLGDVRDLPRVRTWAQGDPALDGPRRRITHHVTQTAPEPSGNLDP